MSEVPQGMGPLIESGPAFGGIGPILMGVAWPFWPVVTTLIVGRIFLRIKRGDDLDRHWVLDSALFLALFAWAAATASVSFLTVATWYGYGNNAANIIKYYFFMRSKYLILATFFSQLASGVAKASAACFLLAMQGRAYPRSGYLLYFLGGMSIAVNLTLGFLLTFLCNPPEQVWWGNPNPAQCHVPTTISFRFNVFQCVWNALADLVLALYPIWLIYQLQMSRQLRILLSCLMGLGLFASAFSFVRLYALSQINLKIRQGPTVILLSVWTTVEMWVVLLVLSIPPIWPILKPYLSVKQYKYSASTKRATPRSGEGASGSNGNSANPNPTFHPQKKSSREPSTTSNAWYGRTAASNDAKYTMSTANNTTTTSMTQPGDWTEEKKSFEERDISEEQLHREDDRTIRVKHEVTVTAPPEEEVPYGQKKKSWPLPLQEV